jgi:NhaA family Na+:H+ antiporter
MKNHVLLEHRPLHAPRADHRAASGPESATQGRRGKRPLFDAWQFALEHLMALPAGALVALVWANLLPESYFRMAYRIAFVVDDVAMVLFLGLMAKEVVEATAPGGVLHPLRRALLPVVSSVGAVLVPPLLYVGVVYAIDEPLLRSVWLVTATVDVALAYLVVRWIFGARHPIVPFLLLLALSADALALLGLGMLHPGRPANGPAGVLLMAMAVGSAAVLRRTRTRSFWPYLLVSGTCAWAGLYVAGLPPALALLPVVPFMPHARRDPGFFVDAPPGSRDALNRFELWARYPMHGALFLFGLVNGGVLLRTVESGIWAVPIATALGRPAGMFAGVGLALVAGLHLPARIGWREVLVAGLAASSGFTLALFVAGAALGPGPLLAETRLGVLLSLVSVPVALAVARALRVGRFQ